MLKKIFTALLALLAAASFAAVDVNKASQAELESIKGIGPALSQRLLDERKKGAFKNWPDVIERVKGVGAGNATRFSAGGLTVDGAVYAGAPAATPAGAKPRTAASLPAATPGATTATTAATAEKPAASRAASGSDRTARKTGDAASASRTAPTAAPGASATKAGAKP